MKWCQSCKTEFEDYVEKCTDCGTLLISDEAYKDSLKQKNQVQNLDALNLTVVYESTLESEILHVSELLKDNGIFSEIKNEGIGSYLQIYSGVNYLGTSICVKEEDADAAKALIDNLWGDVSGDVLTVEDSSLTYDEEEESDMKTYRSDFNKSLNLKRNLLKGFIFLIFGTGLVIQLLVLLQ